MEHNRKEKTCQDKYCENTFFQYKSTDKYCSYSCQAKHTKPPKRTELKRTPFKLSQKSIDKMKAKAKLPKKKTKFQIEFEKQAKNNKDKIIKEDGNLNCEKCSTTFSIQFSTHHIVFRSETPKHPELNNLKNLIYLCYECHESLHKNKKSRNYLIRLRNLTSVFGNIWGYEK
jgi:5-methylcytosine-specific restriction endonuclease McrA